MALFGVTFKDQLIAAGDDAVLHRRLLDDGILYGCGMSASGSSLTIARGWLHACGRVIGNDAALAVEIPATSGFARVKLVIDLSGAATTEIFSQVSLAVETADTAAGFPALVREDLDDGVSTTYEVALAVVSCSSQGIAIVSTLGASAITADVLGLAADQVRPIKIGTATPTENTLAEGEIYLKYST